MTTVNKTTRCKNEISKYKKRPGTSAITGSLYRSHLLSLILSRNLNKETEFVLGCNVDGIGVMNEICFRFLDKDNEGKPVAVFSKSKYTGHITDDDLTNAKSAFNLYKCYQSHIQIKEKFDNEPDALFEGKFNNITPYFVIYTPHQCKIKNHLVELKDNDEIFTNKVNSIICTGKNNNIFKVGGDSLVTDLINSTIEHIGKTIASYVTLSDKDRKETTEDMKNVLLKYGRFLIPHVITINELNENCSAKFNELIHENNDNHIKQLKKVLYTEILKKSKVIDEEASTNIQLLLEANEYTADLLSALVGNVITFDENNNKLAYMPQVSDCIKKKPLNEKKVKTSMVEEAFVIAGKKALKCININFSDLDMSKIITKQESEEEYENDFEAEKQLADRFFQSLYIYTDQVNENDIGKRVLEEIYISQAANKNTTIFKNKPEALLVKFHHKVQEWMLSMDKPQYLTKSCDFLKDNTNIVDPHLSVLNYSCIMELQGYSIKFNSKSFNSLSNLVDIQSRANIISNNVLLTSIKLMQYMSDKSCLFLNVVQVCNMKVMEFDMLIKEINKTTVKTLVVIVCETEKYTTKSNKFREIVANFPGNVYAISNHDIEDFETIYDTVKGLEDTDNINDLLKHEITIQGEKVELRMIVDEKSVNLIDARILNKILTNENIKIGKNLSNSSYDEIKDCFIDRRLCEQSSSCDTILNHISVNSVGKHCVNNIAHIDLDTRTFDFYNEVVVIFAEPGMGKTTFLTHLSVNMKHVYPKTWIVRINLLNFCEDFFKWEEEETDVDIIESMHLVCRAELNNKAFDNLFALEKDSKGDLVVIESKELDPIATLHLKLIIHCFNSGNIIFLFDGFDEICPHYEITVVQFIKSFAIDIVNSNTECFDSDSLGSEINLNQLMTEKASSKDNSEAEINGKQLVITSRPYNAIKKTFETEFDIKPLYLTRLSIFEQNRFYELYWETQIKLVELNTDQLKNVDAFFEHLNKYHLNYDFALGRSRVSRNMLLCRMEEAAVKYFRSKVNSSLDSNIDKQTLLNKWTPPIEIVHADDRFQVEDDDSEQLQLIGIPLHMKIYADIFVNQIKDTSSTKEWDMGVYTFEFYNRFLEIKLKKIRLEEKGGENVNTAAFLTEYEDLVEEVTEEHKKLAFYAFFHNASSHFKKVLPETQWMKIDLIIERIKEAKEKTGLIDQIHNGVPRFVHVVFAEYFAVEYVADMIKKYPLDADQIHRQIDFIVNCVLNSSVGIMTAFNHKLINDKELKEALDRPYTRQCIFTIWLEQDNHFDEDNLNKKTCLTKVLENRLIETAWLLLKGIKDMLNSANVENFVDSISDVFQFTIIIEDLVVYILDAIRCVDPSMVVKALWNCNLQLGDLPENEIILKNLRDRYPGLTLTPLSIKFSGHPTWGVTQKDETVGLIYCRHEALMARLA